MFLRRQAQASPFAKHHSQNRPSVRAQANRHSLAYGAAWASALLSMAACSPEPPIAPAQASSAVAVARDSSGPATSVFAACSNKGIREDGKASLGAFLANTNVWNPNAAKAYTECVSAKHQNAAGTLDARITWDVIDSNNQVLSFPNFSYGWQVGTDQGSTTPTLPVQVARMRDLTASGNVVTACAPGSKCTVNTAFELLFSDTGAPTIWPPSAELMVWVQATCGACNAGKLQGTVTIDGVAFDLYKGMVTPPTGTASWTYVAYVSKSTVNQFNFNFKNFVADSVQRGYLKPSDYLAVVELGAEITSGQGSTIINGYSIR